MGGKVRLGVGCVVAAVAFFAAAGADAVFGSPTGAPAATFPVVLLAAGGVAALGVAAECFGWVRAEGDERAGPKNGLVHGAARPASETETQAAALGIVAPKPAQEATFRD